MGVYDLFSKRQKRLRGEIPDVYSYDEIPNALRTQLFQLFLDGFGNARDSGVMRVFEQVHKMLCREYGMFALTSDRLATDHHHVLQYLLDTEDVERALDVVELLLFVVDTAVRDGRHETFHPEVSPDDVISEANTRFKEHGVGYEYDSGKIIRVDSQKMHSEVVRPALKLLSDEKYAGADQEFRLAHEHYRHSNYKECLNECLKAFESTMKSICDQFGWQYETRDTAKTLIGICISNKLFPSFMQSHIGNLRAILESGVPTIRNKLGGHGQGATVTTVTAETAKFALYQTASVILFFADAEKELKGL